MVKEARKGRADDSSRCAFVVSGLYASVIVRDALALALDSYREAYFNFNLQFTYSARISCTYRGLPTSFLLRPEIAAEGDRKASHQIRLDHNHEIGKLYLAAYAHHCWYMNLCK